MIGYIAGKAYPGDLPDRVIIETGGVGYEILTSPQTAAKFLNCGHTVKVYTYLNVTEGGLSLFGFSSGEEKALFLKLLNVSGVGPKSALVILGALGEANLTRAIITGDEKALLSAPGVGKKTAARIILELKDKLSLKDAMPVFSESIENPQNAAGEALEAMAALGFSRAEALKAVNLVYKEGMDSSATLKEALLALTNSNR